MRVLITGGAGFIGSHLADLYLDLGHKVTIFDNFSTGTKKNIQHLDGLVEIIQGDIRDESLANTAVRNSDLVLHMAASLGVKNIMENPIESISINYHGSEVVLNCANKYNKRILIASTSEIYGKNPNQPLNENSDRVIGSPQNFRWSYSDAKALEEALAQILFQKNGLEVTTIRLFNTVGPRQTGHYGMVIPKFINAALNNNDLEIHGNGLQSRAFCHVLDTVEAITKLMETDKSIGQVYNIGGSFEISIRKLAEIIIEETNSKSNIIYKNYEEVFGLGFEDMMRRVPNTNKIFELVGWKPKRNLKNIIDDVSATF